MTKYRITEILCVVLAVVFIAFSVDTEKNTEKTAEQLVQPLIKLMEDNTLLSRDSAFIRERLKLDTEAFSSFSYYSSDDVMNVNELLIIVFENSVPEGISDGLSDYALDRYNLYNGYAPEAAQYLKDRVISVEGNAVIFCVGKNSSEILSAFSSGL